MGLLVHLARVWLEHDAFAGAERAHVNQRLELVGHLAQVVVGVLLVLDVDVALGAAERVEVLLDIRDLDVLARDQKADHERRIDHLAEA